MPENLPFSKWWLILVSSVSLGAVGAYQYAWPSIKTPLVDVLSISPLSLSTVFTLFILFQSISQFPIGWIRDKKGPKIPLLIGMTLGSLGFLGVIISSTPIHLAFFYCIGGIGTGAVYTVAINTPVKWFKEKRGLASGIVAMAYSGGSFFIIPIFSSINYQHGLIGLSILIFSSTSIAYFILKDPETQETEKTKTKPKNNYSWYKTLKTWQFWILYGIFTIVNGIGLMLVDKIIGFAANSGLTSTIAITAASLIALSEAIGRPILGGISDRLGREKTTSIVLILCGISMYAITLAGQMKLEILFITTVFLSSFFRTPVFAIFPTIIGDYYGASNSSQNYALLYTGKIWGGVFGGFLTAILISSIGWNQTFIVGAILALISGIAALFLKPPNKTTKTIQ